MLQVLIKKFLIPPSPQPSSYSPEAANYSKQFQLAFFPMFCCFCLCFANTCLRGYFLMYFFRFQVFYINFLLWKMIIQLSHSSLPIYIYFIASRSPHVVRSCLLICKNYSKTIPLKKTNKQKTNSLLSHSFCGSGIWEQLNQVLLAQIVP